MRWPWLHRHDRPRRDGAQARADAERKLTETERRDAEIHAITDRLDRIRRQNRFAAMIEQALREH